MDCQGKWRGRIGEDRKPIGVKAVSRCLGAGSQGMPEVVEGESLPRKQVIGPRGMPRKSTANKGRNGTCGRIREEAKGCVNLAASKEERDGGGAKG